jgi:4,4'-diaponeurosporenoate glycosyltransferase
VLAAALILLGLACGLWLGGRRRPLEPAAEHPTATISVVVPARDEERNLPHLLRSLAAQTAKPHEVLVVDDGSTDATAEVAGAHGATVITALDRPDGWLGKPWACQTGADAATGSHLLFLDADVTLAPTAIARLGETHGGGLLTVQPHHRTDRPYEELSLFPNVVALLGTGAAAIAGRPAMRGAFGPCLLTSKVDHQRVGGHAAVHDQLVEDLALGDAYRAAGLPVDGRVGGDVVAYRMYPDGVGQLVEGWTKNLAAGATRVGLAAAGAAAWVAACVGAVVDLVLDPSPLAAGLYALAAFHVGWLGRRVGSFRWWSAALYPIPLAFFVAVFLRSAALTALGRPVAWRGRRVPVG